MDPEQNYLFIGAGGMGMAPLACWMSQAGNSVCGYDAHLQERVRHWLVAAGVSLEDFIFPEQITRFSTVVYSSAVKQSHPLLVAAREAGLRCLRRGEMLAEIARRKRFIAVAGSHGKTTTSGMIAHGLRLSGISADYILGGLSADANMPPASCSGSDWLVAEVDESDGTIDGFSPAVTLVLNVDWDHADRYGDASKLDEAFTGLLNRTQETILLPEAFHLHSSGPATVHRYDGATQRMQLDAPPRGRFNQKNGDAAAAVLSLFEHALKRDTLASFPGMARRQSVLYRDDSLTIVEDYAHHPTEVDALIECLRSNEPDQKLVVVFQPHRYSRTRQFKAAFAKSLQAADEVYLLPVYAAHEAVLAGGETLDLANAFTGQPPVELKMSLQEIPLLAATIRETPTQLAFVGAGNIEEFAGAFASWMRAESAGEARPIDAAFVDYLRARLSPDCTLKREEPLANKTTIRIGGAARFYAEPANLSDLHVLLRTAELFKLKTFCVGRGSNLLVSDHGFDGLVIRFSAIGWRRVTSLGQGRIWAAAGGRLKEICGFAAKHGLGGFEFLEGIPGSVGGALRMNAGAMGSWMFDVVERVQFIDEHGIYQDLPKSAFHFGYRKVEEISRGIALGAVLCSVDSDTEASIRGRIESYSSSRKESQPRGASAGCIFKNPEGNFAGKLIDELGIKGLRVGAAEVSEVHGNFIVNHGGASAADVIELVRQIRAKVKSESGYILEPEVLLVGQTWDEVLSQ
jgi:UDP-N-acetylenolpyruvoylglucosamine reductase